jgi:hypothetical protein
VPTTLNTNTTIWAGLAVDALERLDPILCIDCPIPGSAK